MCENPKRGFFQTAGLHTKNHTMKSRLLAALLFLSSEVFAELSISRYPWSLFVGDGDYLTFSCDDYDLLNAEGTGYAPRVATLSVIDSDGNPSNIMTIQKVDENGKPTGAAGSSIIVPMYNISGGEVGGITSVRAYITGVIPGRAYISYSIIGSYEFSQTTEIKVVGSISIHPVKFRMTKAGDVVESITIAESDLQNGASFYLDFGDELSDSANITITNNAPVGTVDAPQSFRVSKHSSGYVYSFNANDGDQDVIFSVAGYRMDYDNRFWKYTDPKTITVSITNVPPVLTWPTGTEKSPTPKTVYLGLPATFSALARDVQADASLEYLWYKDGAMYQRTSTNSVDATFDADGTFSVQARDKDGGLSRLGWWYVSVSEHPVQQHDHGDSVKVPASAWKESSPELKWRTGGDERWILWWTNTPAGS